MLSYSELINPNDDRVLRLLQVGDKHFKKYGFRKASIGEICAESSISKPTFYKYFDKKETLFFGVLIFLRGAFYSRFEQRIKDVNSATEKISAFLESTEDYLRSTPMLTETFLQSPELYKSWAGHPLNVQSYLAEVDFIESIILEGIAADEFRAADPRRTAHIIMLASTLFVIFEPEMPGTRTDSDARFLFDLLQNGIVKQRVRESSRVES